MFINKNITQHVQYYSASIYCAFVLIPAAQFSFLEVWNMN